tara:strand:+ start:275 stop:604 length:330 start_codon:yes stop_codon:yes gene_type:complete
MQERAELFRFHFPDNTDWNIIESLIKKIDAEISKNPIEGCSFSNRKFNKNLRQTCIICSYSDPTILLKISNIFEEEYLRLNIKRKFLNKTTLKNECCCKEVKEILKACW